MFNLIRTKKIPKFGWYHQEQLIAENNKVISITIKANDKKVKDKIKRVVPKNKKSGPTKDKLNVSKNTNSEKQRKKDVTKTQVKRWSRGKSE